MRFTRAAWLARKMLRVGWARFTQQRQRRKTEVMMARVLKSFDEMSLKVVAVRTADDSDFGFEFPASGPQSTPSARTTRPEQPAEQRRRDSLAAHPEWHHGGLNE